MAVWLHRRDPACAAATFHPRGFICIIQTYLDLRFAPRHAGALSRDHVGLPRTNRWIKIAFYLHFVPCSVAKYVTSSSVTSHSCKFSQNRLNTQMLTERMLKWINIVLLLESFGACNRWSLWSRMQKKQKTWGGPVNKVYLSSVSSLLQCQGRFDLDYILKNKNISTGVQK